MIEEFFLMGGYASYVWSAFIFTFFSFAALYSLTKYELSKNKQIFLKKINSLEIDKAVLAKSQKINKEILIASLNYKF
tara:strand:+ start:510 stop:743 length:234 start_codon:yes stop_codon:yes gene_type:complete